MSEIWVAVPGYCGLYEVSSLGRLRRLERITHHPIYGEMKITQRLAATRASANGYVYAGLVADGVQKRYRLHKLVLSAFIAQPFHGAEVRHLNGDKADNRLENLAWGTARENAGDREDHGKTRRGETHGVAKLTNEQALCIFQSKEDALSISKRFGVSRSLIYKIRNKRCWKRL